MSRTRRTATGALPTYEGRLLPRPDEEVVDQGLAFDVSTLLNRRGLLRAMGLGLGSLTLAACSTSTDSSAVTATASTSDATPSAATPSAATASAAPASSAGATTVSPATGTAAEIPDETAGPFPADGSNGVDVLTRSGIVRRDIRESFGETSTTADGVPLSFEITVLNVADGGSPYAGVAVYAWHCDRDGNYSLYSSGVENENYLRGVQIADSAGKVSFSSIFPACYAGRWPHVHFEVYPDQAAITDATEAIATSQLALPKNICDTVYATTGYEQSVTNLSQVTLQSDNVFGDDAGIHQIPTVTGSLTAGYLAVLTAPVDTGITPAAGNAPGGGPGVGRPPAGAGPSGVRSSDARTRPTS